MPVCLLPAEPLYIIVLKELFFLIFVIPHSPSDFISTLFVSLRKGEFREDKKNLPCCLCKAGSIVTALNISTQ